MSGMNRTCRLLQAEEYHGRQKTKREGKEGLQRTSESTLDDLEV